MDMVCHNRMRAVSLNEEDAASITSKLSAANSDLDLNGVGNNNGSLDSSFDGCNNNDNTFSLKSYIVNIASNQPIQMKRELNKSDISEKKNMSVSWKDRQNDYSFMKR